ncbi:hypothetical protein SDJN02_20347, partial [Cucurbita argyrosperma subsp. argyrosperma]
MSTQRISLSLLFFQFFFLFPSIISAIRNNIGLAVNRSCRSTVQGRYLLADDSGYVCDASSFDPLSRCCLGKGEKFPYKSLMAHDECKSSSSVEHMDAILFHNVVIPTNIVFHAARILQGLFFPYQFELESKNWRLSGCCLQTKREQILKIKIAKPSTAGTYAGVFDFCVGRCRHNSESVVHENAYRSDYHHCFSLPSYSSGVNGTELEFKLNGVNVIIGRQGESCDSVCKTNGQSCIPNKLMVLNHCNIIQEHAYTVAHSQCFLAMAHTRIPEGFVLAPSTSSRY